MDLFYFTPPADNANASSFEYEGAKIGISNTICTVRKNFTNSPSNQINVDELVFEKMFAHIKNIEGKEKIFLCDIIVHGVRVRLTTNSKHIAEFFTDNFYNPREYSEQLQTLGIEKQGSIVPFKVNIYAINGLFDNAPLYCYHASTNSIYIFNCSFYSVLYEHVMNAISKILREDRGFLIEKCCVIEKNKESVAVVGCHNKNHECNDKYCANCFRTVQDKTIKLQALEHCVFRFAFKTVSGNKRLSPIKAVFSNGEVKKGFEVLEFIEKCMTDDIYLTENGGTVLSCLSPLDEKIEITLCELDLKSGAEIYSYPVFKNYYQKTSMVKHLPASAYQFLHSKLENIAEITQDYILANASYYENFVRNELRGSKDASIAKYFNSISEEDGKKYIARFECFDESFVMIDMSKIFGKVKIISNPFEYAQLKSICFFNHKSPSVNFDSCTFMRIISGNKAVKEHPDSVFVKMINSLSLNNTAKCDIYFYDEIKKENSGSEEIKIEAIYDEIIKSLFTKKNQEGEMVIDSSNYKSLFPPPPPKAT